jgi:hypothetical protein
MEKAKAGFGNFINKTKTMASRAEQKVMQKTGKAETTTDITYSQEKERFLEMYKLIQKFQKDTSKFLDVIRELSLYQTNLSDYFSELFESAHPYYTLGTKGVEVAKMLDNARLEMDTMMRNDILDPAKRYEIQYKEIDIRLEERSTRRVDMDRYAKDLKTAQEKNKIDKIPTLEQKLAASKANYQALHEELLKDLPLLYEDRIPFFDPVFATFFVTLYNLYDASTKATAELVPLISPINLSEVLTHPRVITDVNVSSFKNKVASGTVSAMDYTPPNTVPATTPAKPAPALPSQPSQPSQQVRAIGLFDFNAQDDTELGFKANDVITILDQSGEWWKGELHGKVGLLPSNYVKVI